MPVRACPSWCISPLTPPAGAAHDGLQQPGRILNTDLQALMTAESPDALVALDLRGTVLGWNPAAEALFGYSAEQARDLTLDELITAPGQPALQAALEQARSGQRAQVEHLCRHRDGTLIHVLCTLQARHLGDGAGPPRLHCALTDVTPMRVLRDRQLVVARYQGLLELAPDAIVIVNAIGRIVLLNARARAMFGHEEADVLGEPIEVLLPQRLRTDHAGHRNAYLAAPRMRGMGEGLELAGVRRDGSEFPVEISLSPIDSDVGRLVMSAIRDTTERKRIERALQDKNIELERANRAKDHFLATMSHELRTPLNAILGFTGLLLMQLPGPLNAAQQRQLELVQSSGKHLLSLINDLLDLAKIDAGRTDMHIEAVHCATVLEEVAATLRPAAVAKGLELELQTPPDPVLALADRRALHQVVLNLASNAVKFTARGQVRLDLRQAVDDVCIEVTDTGAGISEADRRQLFEAFRQLGEPRQAGAEGSGLGLHLSRRLAELMHGRIECASVLGQGSTFSLHLPAAPQGAA